MKRLYFILILYILSGFLNAQSREITPDCIKVNSIVLTNNKIAVKTTVNGHKVILRTPKLSKNKYLRLVNIVY